MSEYKKYHSSDKMKKERALRNKNRRAAIRQGKVKKGDGKHIDHKVRNKRKGMSLLDVDTNRLTYRRGTWSNWRMEQ